METTGNIIMIAGEEGMEFTAKNDIKIYCENYIADAAKGIEINADGGQVFGTPEAYTPGGSDNKPPVCEHCDEDITIEQIRAVYGGNLPKTKAQNGEENAKKILPYLNLYRKDFALDTCIRKAHFIAQILHETGGFIVGPEDPSYKASTLKGFNKNIIRFYEDALLADYFIKPVADTKKCYGYLTEEYLNDIIQVQCKDTKTPHKKSLKDLLKEEPYSLIEVDQTTLYGSTDTDIVLYPKKREDSEIKIILKRHSAFGVGIFSRAYGGWMKNGDELTRDGYKFRGKGILQLTGRESYEPFTKYRKNHPFTGDTTGYIDFTEDDKDSTKDNPKGKYDKIADYSTPIYAVQSAVWEWAILKEKDKKIITNGADKDDILKTTQSINGGYNGLKVRNENIKRARNDSALKVYSHYEAIYKNGTNADKKIIQENLKLLSTKRIKKDGTLKKDKNVDVEDTNAKALLDKLFPSK